MARSTIKKSPVAAARATAPRAPKAACTPSDVARLAYDFYLARGCGPGHDVEDWIRAERELGTALKAPKR